MNTNTEEKPRPHVNPMRWVGLFMFIGGVALGYLAIILPLNEAARHEEEISLSAKGVGLVPGLIAFGLILFFMGNQKAGELFGSREKPRKLGLAIIFAVAILGILLHEWLQGRLRAYGYHF